MRIVGGRHRGRPLTAPPGTAVRPTADRVREALFDILEHGRFAEAGGSPLPGACVLDAFAGTGALGLEALSRGAAHLTCMERDAAAIAAIRTNARRLGELARVTLLAADAADPPAPLLRGSAPCAVAFLDPPYGSGLAAPALAALAAKGWLAAAAIAVLELAKGEPFAPPAGFALADERRYGKTRLLFLRRG